MAHEMTHVGLYVIFGIILLPVYAMIAGWILGKPHDYRTVAMTFGYAIGFIVLVIVGLFVLDVVIGLFVDY